MSPDISDVGGTPPVKRATPFTRGSGRPQQVVPAGAATDPVSVDTLPASPPPEVQDAIGVAADAYDRLAAIGRELRFNVNESTGEVAITVHDADGNQLATLSPSEVLDIASGGAPLD